VLHQPVETAEQSGGGPGAGRAQHPTDHNRAPGATPTTPKALSSAATTLATMVAWPSRSPKPWSRLHCNATADVEFRLAGIDAGVEDRHVGVDAGVAVVDRSGRTVQRPDARDPARDDLERCSPYQRAGN
jgi:hypothetical protein